MNNFRVFNRNDFGQWISNSLYGCKSFVWEEVATYRLLSGLIRVIKGVDELALQTGVTMTAQGLGSSFLGVQNLSGQSEEMQCILSLMAACIHKCSTDIDSQVVHINFIILIFIFLVHNQAFANILLGLKSCSASSLEARRVLSNLAKYMRQNGRWKRTLVSLKSSEVSMCIWGLQGMSSDLVEVKEILRLINEAFEIKKTNLQAVLKFRSWEEISMLLAGMKNMNTDCPHLSMFLMHVSQSVNDYFNTQNLQQVILLAMDLTNFDIKM